jgi:hypothetical protein
MDRIDLTSATWLKSSRSNGQSACLEAAPGFPGVMPVRDSKNPHGPALLLPAFAWGAFITAVRAGEL